MKLSPGFWPSTPGPWHYEIEGTRVVVRATEAPDIVIADCGRSNSLAALANARLIAAAPKILDALKLVLNLWGKDHALDHFNWAASALTAENFRELNELPFTIREAIAAAESTSASTDAQPSGEKK